MDIFNRTYWQQGGGDGDRVYCDICFQYGVILNGPGYAGKLNINVKKKMLSDGISPRKVSDLQRFCFEMQEGDIVVLRVGTKEIHGVGVIVGEYEWNNIFSDVDGWDMQHCRRVRWLWKAEGKTKAKEFPVYTLKQGDTTQKLTSDDVKDWIDSLGLDLKKEVKIPVLPDENTEETSIEDISDYLYEKGVAGNSIKTLVDVIDDLHMIAKWYKRTPAPSEFETEAYLIIPLLRALGWTPQKMAIEWNRVDIALFDKLPREDANLIAVVEAKRKGNSCLTAFSQAEDYSKNKSRCNRLIVTDGLRYGVFIKDGDVYIRHAYMNLTEFKGKYEIYECAGIKEALWAMTPDWHLDV
ncbi:hypothetical protein BKP37_02225 [Anaerobacillus alkalilacustris]|uniref:Uncharacterized protein n=1 Tax=Anaerobacillus alkalilacustris TaxID=393763 RepID=A0A1S2LYQ0_9BACI|nr:hypothetical protein [Anaerobacillus alkalilacustris]OIJ17343.1 hypothetical protein BKP37_02225 [Anaerobacillus alkalilacustris]